MRSSDGVWLVFFFVVLQCFIRGAFTVFVVVVAIDLLDRGESDVGVLQGAVGIGALVGSAACTLLVGSRAMTRWLSIAVVLWGAPMAVMGLLPEYAVALLAAAVIGIGNAMVDVTAFTLVARMVPDAVLARVFGVLESLGALASAWARWPRRCSSRPWVPGRLDRVGLLAPVACVLLWWRCDDRRPLGLGAHRRHRPASPGADAPPAAGQRRSSSWPRTPNGREVPAGVAVFEAGDVGDRFYVVEEGSVDVLDGEQRRAHDGSRARASARSPCSATPRAR